MNATKKWIVDQMNDYRQMIGALGNTESDRCLYIIWKERINTLKSVLAVMETENETYSEWRKRCFNDRATTLALVNGK